MTLYEVELMSYEVVYYKSFRNIEEIYDIFGRNEDFFITTENEMISVREIKRIKEVETK